MPPKGVNTRAEVMATLTGLMHEKTSDPRVGEWLAACEKTGLTHDVTSTTAVNIKEWRRQYDKAVQVPQKLAEAIAQTASLAKQAWVEARKEDHFGKFEPKLTQLVGLIKQKAQCFGLAIPYDVLIDYFEPEATSIQITEIFKQLKTELVPLMQKIINSKKYSDDSPCHGAYPLETQKKLALEAIQTIGFDLEAGRVDTTAHPFSLTVGANDVRLATRYSPDCFNDTFFCLMHESGHGLYEQGLPEEHYGTPRGRTVSVGIHESQSLFWENMIGRSLGFWQYFYPHVQKAFPQNLARVSVDAFYRAVNTVKPSFIRVEADEVTYPLHVILRYEIEQEIFADKIQVKDIPQVWNERFEKLLGLKVPDNRQGCLQDIHWSLGIFGYFPTYLLGKLYAACFYEKAQSDLGDINELCSRGEFAKILHWLRTNIHKPGMTYNATELCQHVCGKPLLHGPLMAYLKKKFLD